MKKNVTAWNIFFYRNEIRTFTTTIPTQPRTYGATPPAIQKIQKVAFHKFIRIT